MSEYIRGDFPDRYDKGEIPPKGDLAKITLEVLDALYKEEEEAMRMSFTYGVGSRSMISISLMQLGNI